MITSGCTRQMTSWVRTMSSGSWITGRPNQLNEYWYFWFQPTRSHWSAIRANASSE